MINAVIFDFDGTLVDSEPNYAQSDVNLMKRYDVNLTMDDHHKYIGIGAESFIRSIKQEYGLDAPDQEIRRGLAEEYLKLALENTPVFPEMGRLIKELHERNVPMAVASGTPLDLLETLLDHVGLRNFFPVVLSSDQVEQGKPAPDVFLKAAELLEIEPAKCLVLEDSPPGAMAAQAAGMDLITIPGVYLKDNHDRYPDHGIFLKEGMNQFKAEMVLDKLELLSNCCR